MMKTLLIVIGCGLVSAIAADENGSAPTGSCPPERGSRIEFETHDSWLYPQPKGNDFYERDENRTIFKFLRPELTLFGIPQRIIQHINVSDQTRLIRGRDQQLTRTGPYATLGIEF